MPDLVATLQIKGLTKISETDSVELYAVLLTSTLYSLSFKWEVKYNSEVLSATTNKELAKYLAAYSEFGPNIMFTIPSIYLSKGLFLNVLLSAKAKSFDSAIVNATTMITVLESVEKVTFISKSQYIVELDGTKNNSIPICIDNGKIIKSNENASSAASVNFQISSGDKQDSITTRGNDEIATETKINEIISKISEIKEIVNLNLIRVEAIESDL